MHIRNTLWLVALLPALMFLGCGGGTGGGGIDPAAETVTFGAPKIEGVVLDVDGESDLAGGVPLMLQETGEIVVTDPEGGFAFSSIPEGDLTIVLASAGGVVLQKAGDAGGGGGNDGSGKDDSGNDDSGNDDSGKDDSGNDDSGKDADDDHQRRDGDVRIRRIRKGDRLHISIRIRNRLIVDLRVWRNRGDEDDECAARELELEMKRCEDNDDTDMEGEVELEADCDHQSFEVEVENAEPDAELEAFVIDPDGNEESLGVRTVEADGDAEWRLDTADGDDLPFEVERLRALEKHGVRVRDADGNALLCARIPDFPPVHDPGGLCLRLRARARLFSESESAKGYVEMRVRGCQGEGFDQRFRIVAEGLEEGQEVEFFLEDPDDEGSLVSLGTVIADEVGEADIEFDTSDGDELPFGVESVRDLFGLAIEVRDDVTGDVLLEGKVPGKLQD